MTGFEKMTKVGKVLGLLGLTCLLAGLLWSSEMTRETPWEDNLQWSASVPGAALIAELDQAPLVTPDSVDYLEAKALAKKPEAGRFSKYRNPASRFPATPDQAILGAIVKKNADRQGVDEDLVWAVMRHESGFNPGAVSPMGAMGLMQLMPGTAAMLGVTDPFNVEQNVAGGVRYLRFCLDYFDQDTDLALAAYNAGPGNVIKHQGVPPFAETINYVAAVINDYVGQVRPRGLSRTSGNASAGAGTGVVRAPGLNWRVPLPRWKIASPQDKLGAPRWHGRVIVAEMGGKTFVSLGKRSPKPKASSGGKEVSNL